MRLSEERIEAIGQAVVDRLAEEELVDLTIEEEELAAAVAEVLQKNLAREDEIQREAVEWLARHKSTLTQGTSEWEIALELKREDLAIARGYVLP